MTALWIVLLALVIFFMYMWSGKLMQAPSPPGGGCNACSKKNVQSIE